ncbi:CTDSPL2 [Mytilus edulis]|uniref:CTDSPL2 n=1 Tax=Mytilus edulis TaxID=6550 RepID=A0A8S3Q0K9_MYTED|nr:CTDSPL2 [Mytilus edulis]
MISFLFSDFSNVGSSETNFNMQLRQKSGTMTRLRTKKGGVKKKNGRQKRTAVQTEDQDVSEEKKYKMSFESRAEGGEPDMISSTPCLRVKGKKKPEVLNPVQENQNPPCPGSPPRTSGTLFSPVYSYVDGEEDEDHHKHLHVHKSLDFSQCTDIPSSFTNEEEDSDSASSSLYNTTLPRLIHHHTHKSVHYSQCTDKLSLYVSMRKYSDLFCLV